MKSLKKFLFENEPVIGINKPTDYLYLKLLRLHLVPINAWPVQEEGADHWKRKTLINVAHLILNLFCLITGIMYLLIHSETLSFYELGHMYITLFATIVAMSRILGTFPQCTKYSDITAAFATKMHLFHHKDVSDYAMEMHKQIHLISHVFTFYLTGQFLGVVFLFNFIPILNNYFNGKYSGKILQNSTYEHSIYFSLPFNTATHFDAYLFACIYNWIISYLCSTLICMLDLLLSLMVFHLWGHFKILLHDLDTFPLPANKAVMSVIKGKSTITAEMYSEEELKQVARRLKQCIVYHRDIVDFTYKMSDAFGSMLLVYYMFHQVSGCLLLLECSQMTVEALVRYVPLTVIFLQQLIQLSIIFELIGATSMKLKDAVYGVPWQYMDTKNRKTVAIFLINVQRPIRVKALGFVDIGVTSMAAILKTSLSYFTFLRSM